MSDGAFSWIRRDRILYILVFSSFGWAKSVHQMSNKFRNYPPVEVEPLPKQSQLNYQKWVKQFNNAFVILWTNAQKYIQLINIVSVWRIKWKGNFFALYLNLVEWIDSRQPKCFFHRQRKIIIIIFHCRHHHHKTVAVE